MNDQTHPIPNLLSSPALAGLSDEALNAFLAKAVKVNFSAGETVYNVGDPPGGIYYVQSGGLRVEFPTGTHETFLGHFLPVGTWFGEPSALSGQPRMLSVYAPEASELLYVSLANLNYLTDRHPEILRNLAKITQFHLRTAIGAIADLMIRDTEARIVSVILRLAGIRDTEHLHDKYDVFFSQEEIAGMSNVARSTANVLLQKLEKQKIIEITYRRISIVNPKRLREIAGKES